jgi:putative transposase
MRRKRFSPEQIVAILREASTGQETVEAVCRRHGISDTTYYRWKQLYEG